MKYNCVGVFVKYFINKNLKVVVKIILYVVRKLRYLLDRFSLFGESGYLNRIEYVGDRMGVVVGKVRYKVRYIDIGK